MTVRKLVILESPYAGDVERNTAYARAALADSLRRGEAPIASHLLYTQPGVLDDKIPAERAAGIEAGLAWGRVAEMTAVYVDLGFSSGMRLGVERARAEGRSVDWRQVSPLSEFYGGDDVHRFCRIENTYEARLHARRLFAARKAKGMA